MCEAHHPYMHPLCEVCNVRIKACAIGGELEMLADRPTLPLYPAPGLKLGAEMTDDARAWLAAPAWFVAWDDGVRH